MNKIAISLGLCLVFAVSMAQKKTKLNVKPNIIYILVDDMGYGDLGCYGQKEIKTPAIDKLASDGMRFTQHYAGSAVCAPSRCVLMTGLHTGHAKIRGNIPTVELDGRDTTIASLLQKVGYKTAAIGKWGLGEGGAEGKPSKQGFDYFFGYLNQIRAHNFYPDFLYRNDDIVPLENEVVLATSGYAKGVGSASTKKKVYSHDLFINESLQFVENNTKNPFFVYLAVTIPHANDEFHVIKDEHGMEVPDYGIYANRNWPNAQKGLASMISYLDKDVARLRNKLKATSKN